MFNLWRFTLAVWAGFFLITANSEAAELVISEQKNAVHFVLSTQGGDEIAAEKADFSLIYGLDLQIRQGDTTYSLSSQDMDFVFPEVTSLSEGVLLGRSISKRHLAAMFKINKAGSYNMTATLCLSDGACLEKVESELEFSSADF